MIYVDTKMQGPLYEQLYDRIRFEIVKGNYKYNYKLTSIRKMAEDLKVSRNTVDHAYQQLVSEGYLRAVRGAGYFVDYHEEKIEPKNKYVEKCGCEAHRKLKYDFSYENMEASQFPWTKWRKYVQDALFLEESSNVICYESNKGNYALRESLCRYLRNSRGIHCNPEQIIIGAGTQYLLQILTNILPRKAYRLAFEEPGYNGIKKVFANGGYEIEPISVQDNGIDMDEVKRRSCDLLYVTPSHQFPTGVTTSLEKRVEMLKWANENDTYIIENDYDNEFNYGERRLPSLQAICHNDRVIYISMLTKVLSPLIRCAYMVLPNNLVKIYEDQFRFFNTSLPNYHQVALANFIDNGMLDKHIREMAGLNKRKLDIIRQIFDLYGEGQISLCGCPSGSHVLIKVVRCKNQNDLISYMRKNSIGLYSTRQYWSDKDKAEENLFLLGFNSMNEATLKSGCLNFVRALHRYFVDFEGLSIAQSLIMDKIENMECKFS